MSIVRPFITPYGPCRGLGQLGKGTPVLNSPQWTRAFSSQANRTYATTSGGSSTAPKTAFPDSPVFLADPNELLNQPLAAHTRIDWTKSFYGCATEPFPAEVRDVLLAPVDSSDVEIKVDGLIYLPEIKYRRILNRAFGPGGWGLAPRGPHTVGQSNISREYALICRGRFVSQARGEQDYFSKDGIATAAEGCKSNALMRCCKDLGISSELWDPVFIRAFKDKQCVMELAEHVVKKTKKMMWRRKDREFEYPFRKASTK
ncbi:hypothetical protein H4R33_004596 [Dimargaris cristalligena]|uniref:Mitochondrial genome maintenance protein MGM101 n=1 Tax=Dimargaris cristalligena TaxID=215637 RepID=A0A4P9ZKZ1_9FUNG|nr:hypothetical protein H4R33_004596 [Dimargaris cristalligena]RKP33738.1 mitochondrial genome maintenance MGM101-domain-containing protein [Dimargaris cristalligena]|eukprot:RKP33738.1 mitochondrial genome maintenance MGM101-domain-containing protein [Dimargaris cristalligena]